jgi:pyruvate dehydrogenase E1 component alpha subunit
MTSTSPTERHSDQLEPQDLKDMLQRMMLIRRFEERTMQSYQQAKIGGFCHIYIGQEATAVGAIWAMRKTDPLITAYRDHGHALACGMPARDVMAEMFGKIHGCAKGKGGSMHMFDKSRSMYGGHAIVGGQCPLAVGLAWGVKYKKEDNVVLCFLGDGALNQGAFHESMNLAGLFDLPVLMCVENNGYSMGTSIERGTTKADDLSAKAHSYGMRFAECDGMNALEVYDCIAEQLHKTRPSGEDAGPAFVEIKTYRYQGHSMSDPRKYRSREEEERYEQHYDPIKRLSAKLVDRGVLTQEQVDEMDQKAKDEAIDAQKFADSDEPTPMDELYTDVYSEPFPPFKPTSLPPAIRPRLEQQ